MKNWWMSLNAEEKKKVYVTAAMSVIALIVLMMVWDYYNGSPWTRDGKIRADVIALAPDVSGRVVDVLVKDNEEVKAGQVLFRIDPSRLQITLDRAEATLQNSELARSQARREGNRYGSLKGVVSDEVRLSKSTSASQAEAAYAQALADRDLAKLNLERSEVKAPGPGIVTNFSLRAGAYVNAGVPVTAFVATDSFYVAGYFEETKLNRIRVGAPVSIRLLGYGGVLKGKVESIASGIEDRERTTASGTLLSNVNPTFAWVRLPQRVPVRVQLTEVPKDLHLVAGRTATVTVLD